jgi:hypothetical protein
MNFVVIRGITTRLVKFFVFGVLKGIQAITPGCLLFLHQVYLPAAKVYILLCRHYKKLLTFCRKAKKGFSF